MIAHLKGEIIKITEKGVILSNGHIGYFVHLSKSEIAEVKIGNETEYFIHTHVKEDTLDLYGFINFEQLEFFKQLISISGIGPKVGLEILTMPTNQVKAAIMQEEVDFIKKIPGIGPKTAKRIILELKGKIEIENIEDLEVRVTASDVHKDAIEALIQLGYHRRHITDALRKMPEEIIVAEEVITYFLKNH